MNDSTKTDLKKATRHDVDKDILFHCLIGNSEVILFIMIEPDPHGDETGNHAHFHTGIRCPNIEIVDFPEPDRCQITDMTCPFIAPLGSHERSPELRKRNYAHTIIQMMALIEAYGSQLVNKVLGSKGLRHTPDNLRVVELANIMIISGWIDNETFEKINSLRRVRNKFAHKPRQYLEFTEKELYEMSIDARELANAIKNLLSKAGKAELRMFKVNRHK